MSQQHSALQLVLAVRQPQPQVEALPPMERAEEVQLVQELHTLVQQISV